jgi:hypothetical protein
MITSENIGTIMLLFVVAVGVEKHYISRTGILPNMFIVLFLLTAKWDSLPVLAQYWLGAGVVIGAVALISYLKILPIPSPFSRFIYRFSYALYSLKTILGIYIGILLFDIPNGLYGGIPILLAIWFVSVRYLKNDLPWK